MMPMPPDPTGLDRARTGRRSRWWIVVLAFIAGISIALVYWRHQALALATWARPYARRRARVTNPALIINRWSGDGKAAEYGLEESAERFGAQVIMLERGDDLAQLAHDAIDAGADAIGMAGGDGSLGLVAGVAIERGVPFFCVPVGTRNHFALDLGLDRDDPLAALDAVRDGDEIRIDYGVAGTRVFLNNVSFGVYAQAVHREGYRVEKEATISAVVYEAAGNADAQAAIRYVTPDGVRHERAPLLLVSNNRYLMSGPPDFGRRLRLDSGRLGIKAVTSLAHVIATEPAPLSQIRALNEWEATDFRLESDEPILAGVDGEALVFESPLELTVQRRGLRVLVPEGTRPGYAPVGESVAARLIDMVGIGGPVES